MPETGLPLTSLLCISVNTKGNQPPPLTALLCRVMVTVVGWARNTPTMQSPAYLSAGVLYTPALFFPYSLLSFRELNLVEIHLSALNPPPGSFRFTTHAFRCRALLTGEGAELEIAPV
jgi:hypothetical protein